MSFDPMNLDDGNELCTLAGRDPDETLTRFSLVDFATTVLGIEGLTQEQRIEIVKAVDASRLGDLICEVSHWDEAFEEHIRYKHPEYMEHAWE